MKLRTIAELDVLPVHSVVVVDGWELWQKTRPSRVGGGNWADRSDDYDRDLRYDALTVLRQAYDSEGPYAEVIYTPEEGA